MDEDAQISSLAEMTPLVQAAGAAAAADTVSPIAPFDATKSMLASQSQTTSMQNANIAPNNTPSKAPAIASAAQNGMNNIASRLSQPLPTQHFAAPTVSPIQGIPTSPSSPASIGQIPAMQTPQVMSPPSLPSTFMATSDRLAKKFIDMNTKELDNMMQSIFDKFVKGRS